MTKRWRHVVSTYVASIDVNVSEKIEEEAHKGSVRASTRLGTIVESITDSTRDYCKCNLYKLTEFAACVENVKLYRVRLDHDEASESCSLYVCR